MLKNSSAIFPEIFITGELPKNYDEVALVATGLCGWAACMMGNEPPKMFGLGMAKIASIVGVAKPEGLSKLADRIKTERDKK